MNKKVKTLFILCSTILFISGCNKDSKTENDNSLKKQNQNYHNKDKPKKETKIEEIHEGISLDKMQSADETLTTKKNGVDTDIWFLNTGMSDSILIKDHEEFMLIDTGDNNDSEVLKKAFKEKGVKNLKYLILTSWDYDAIGSVKEVFNNCTVNQIIAPNITPNASNYGKGAFSFIKSINKNIEVPKVEGESHILDISEFKIHNVNSNSNEENGQSLVIEFNSSNTKALFTSDILAPQEKNILSTIGKLALLKVARHGASDTTTNEFLKITMPEYSVILTGDATDLANSEKIDSSEVESRLNKINSKIFKTNKNGEIHFKIDNSGLYHTKNI
ncbi:ComEC/Rec2 family competence protein [Clostridioides difficile]